MEDRIPYKDGKNAVTRPRRFLGLRLMTRRRKTRQTVDPALFLYFG